MKRFVEIAWNSPIDEGLFQHLRNDLRFNEDHKKVFDSVTNYSGDLDFHADNTKIDKKRFSRLYTHVAENVLVELIRLAAVGYKTESKRKSTEN